MRFKRQQLQAFINEDPLETITHPINKYVVVVESAELGKFDEIMS